MIFSSATVDDAEAFSTDATVTAASVVCLLFSKLGCARSRSEERGASLAVHEKAEV